MPEQSEREWYLPEALTYTTTSSSAINGISSAACCTEATGADMSSQQREQGIFPALCASEISIAVLFFMPEQSE